MHAILVTFRPEAPDAEIMQALAPKMKILAATPGLIMKTFVASDPQTRGGFLLFSTKEHAEGYLEGDFFHWFSNTPVISNVQVQHFNVNDEPSKAFGTPSIPLAEPKAA